MKDVDTRLRRLQSSFGVLVRFRLAKTIVHDRVERGGRIWTVAIHRMEIWFAARTKNGRERSCTLHHIWGPLGH